MKGKKILIVGGTGFIGYHFAIRCLKLNLKVFSISQNKPKRVRRIKNVIYKYCNISNKKDLQKKLKNQNYHYVVNLGGCVDHINKKKTYNSHFIGVKNLFDLLKKKKIEIFVQIGSSGEYGNLKSPHKEIKNGKPRTIYGKSKFLATNFLLNSHKKFNFPVTILRFYQIFGPGQDNNRFLPQLIMSCLKKKVFFTSSGEQSRDFLYIDDAINAILCSLKTKSSIGKVINIGSGSALKLKKIMFLVKKKLKYFNPIYGKIKLRKDEPQIIYPNINRAKKIIKWKNKTRFNLGLDKTIRYYKKVSK